MKPYLLAPSPSQGTKRKSHFLTRKFLWQQVTHGADLHLAFRLGLKFDIEAVRNEIALIEKTYSAVTQNGPYHTGGWKSIGLITANGDWREDRVLGQDQSWFRKTEALSMAPTVEKIIDAFPCEKMRVRISRLAPAQRIYWHWDQVYSPDLRILRVHLPVITNDKVYLQICHQNMWWQPGEIWAGDFSFPHRVFNASEQHRTHILFDFVMNENLQALIPRHFAEQYRLRQELRPLTQQLCEPTAKLARKKGRTRQKQALRESTPT